MTTTIAVNKRTDTGKGVARKLRKTGQIPAVLYGVEAEALPLTVDPKVLVDIFRETRNRNTLLELDIEGQKVHAWSERHSVILCHATCCTWTSNRSTRRSQFRSWSQ